MHNQKNDQPRIAQSKEKREQGLPAGAALSLPSMNAEVSRANLMNWKLACSDAGDGSSNLILDLRDDLLQAAGWAEGDPLELEPDPNDSTIRLTKVVLCDESDASTAETGLT